MENKKEMLSKRRTGWREGLTCNCCVTGEPRRKMRLVSKLPIFDDELRFKNPRARCLDDDVGANERYRRRPLNCRQLR